MSATKDIKKDSVIEMLKSELESDPKNELIKMLLYANPNGSGVQDSTQPTYSKLTERIRMMNGTQGHEFDYTDLELTTKSVSLPVRVRFAIEELVGALEMLNLARTRIHVEQSSGNTWPPATTSVGSANIKVGPQFIKSMKAIVRDYLITQLPNLIDDCYEAHYKNAGNFSYSLLETKFFVVSDRVMGAFITWVNAAVLQPYQGFPDETPLFTSIITKNDSQVDNYPTRLVMMDELWVNTSVIKGTDSYKYPSHYVKLCKVICARLGKFLRPANTTEEWKNEGNAQEIEAKRQASLDFVQKYVSEHVADTGKQPGSAIMLPNSRKKDFQRAVYEILLEKMTVAYSRAAAAHQQNPSVDIKSYIRHFVIHLVRDLVLHSRGIDYQTSLVHIDSFEFALRSEGSFMTFATHFTKGEFLTSLNAFSSGICNPRVMETFYRFISTHSQSLRDSSRKTIPEEIEVEILKNADLSRFEGDTSDEPALCFSQSALAKAGRSGDAIARPRDKSGLTGFRQNGVMSLTACMKDKAQSAALDQHTYAPLLVHANVINEVADCYVMVYAGVFEARKIKKNKAAAHQRQLAKNTGRAGGASPTFQYAQGGTSPQVHTTVSYLPQVQGGLSPQVQTTVSYLPQVQRGLSPQGQGVRYGNSPVVEANLFDSVAQVQHKVEASSSPKSRSSSPTTHQLFPGQVQTEPAFPGQGTLPAFPAPVPVLGATSPRVGASPVVSLTTPFGQDNIFNQGN